MNGYGMVLVCGFFCPPSSEFGRISLLAHSCPFAQSSRPEMPEMALGIGPCWSHGVWDLDLSPGVLGLYLCFGVLGLWVYARISGGFLVYTFHVCMWILECFETEYWSPGDVGVWPRILGVQRSCTRTQLTQPLHLSEVWNVRWGCGEARPSWPQASRGRIFSLPGCSNAHWDPGGQ